MAEGERRSDPPVAAPQEPPLAPWGQPQWEQHPTQSERRGPYQWGPAPEQNPLAIIGFVCSLAGLILLVTVAPFTFGFSMLFSAPLSIAGLVCGLLGRQKVDRGELSTQRGLAQAGFALGIIGIVLHVVAVVVGVVLVALLIDALGDFAPPDQAFLAAIAGQQPP